MNRDSYDEVSDDDGGHEEGNAGGVTDEEAVPHHFDPLAAQHAEDHHKRVHKVGKVPARHIFARETVHIICSTTTTTTATTIVDAVNQM